MKDNTILNAFLSNNVLCHTDADVLEDFSDDENLDDAAYGWAESLQKNLAQSLNSESLSPLQVKEVFIYFKRCNKEELSEKIINAYPENIDWLFDQETKIALEKLISYFLDNWLTVNEINGSEQLDF